MRRRLGPADSEHSFPGPGGVRAGPGPARGMPLKPEGPGHGPGESLAACIFEQCHGPWNAGRGAQCQCQWPGALHLFGRKGIVTTVTKPPYNFDRFRLGGAEGTGRDIGSCAPGCGVGVLSHTSRARMALTKSFLQRRELTIPVTKERCAASSSEFLPIWVTPTLLLETIAVQRPTLTWVLPLPGVRFSQAKSREVELARQQKSASFRHLQPNPTKPFLLDVRELSFNKSGVAVGAVPGSARLSRLLT